MSVLTELLDLSDKSLYRAAAFLRSGGLVVFPTETVYGLGANALNPEACRRIFQAKGRPQDNPLIVHLACVEDLQHYTQPLTKEQKALMERCMPGPITFILPKSPIIPDLVTAGLPTVALRIPALPQARQLIAYAGVPVAAPSANRSGEPSPTTFEMAYEAMYGRVEAILKGSPCSVGLESSVVRMEKNLLELLRPGYFSLEELRYLGQDLGFKVMDSSHTPIKDTPPPSPGIKYSHYKPKTPLYLFSSLEALSSLPPTLSSPIRILYSREALTEKIGASPLHMKLLEGNTLEFKDLSEYARNLFIQFYQADREGIGTLLAWYPPPVGIGLALRNRLIKASEGKFV
ncbi:MAG: L-threonylcarbamoyladenylate synthase [Spirochaetales bacterium]